MKKMLIENYPDYFILENGVVWSIKSNKAMKHHINPNGYKYVGLSKDGTEKRFYIHRLLGIHFIPNPDNKPTIDHINRIRDDNRLENLRWATRSEQNENRKEESLSKNNTSGHKCISFNNDRKKWIYCKTGKYKVHKYLKCKIDALCFKFYWELKMNVSQKRLRNFQIQL